MIEALNIQVRGIVQGVGFRPFVYRLAKKYLINGWVLNAADGVFIHAEGEAKHLDEFIIEISENAPAAAQVTEIEMKEVPLDDFTSFEIRFSDEGSVEKTTLISPDLASCSDCVHELFDENDRRYRYPFINCTNCGPRFTIIDALPYDRLNTSMKDFPMCEQCRTEYENPLDRRFHAQPDACFECGPQISWKVVSRCGQSPQHELKAGEAATKTRWGSSRAESDAILAEAVDALRDGKILAVKGLGGFHLVCDAQNEAALATLRERKRRKGQAFAVMAENLNAVEELCEVNALEKEILTGSQRPIVLLKKRIGAHFARGLADNLCELGVMLPYTPLQHLLVHDFGGMLVMTSGNIHDEPIVIDDEEAYRVLENVADAFIGNNRSIEARYDDSVVRVIRVGENDFSMQFVRRARGYAPMPLALPKSLEASQPQQTTQAQQEPQPQHEPQPQQTTHLQQEPQPQQAVQIFATGPEQKNTFCLTRENEAFVSQHIGDMENAETFDAWLAAKKRYETLFEIDSQKVACDMHPEYLTTKWAQEQMSAKKFEKLIGVQHHHAHIVSVLAENNLEGPVAGFAFDGTGYGADGAIWGGEVLLANLQAYERFANFAYVPMPGGAAAIKHPLRMAYGALWAFDLLEHPCAQKLIERLGDSAAICEQMIEQGLNTPMTSSLGRLFDAASAILGICLEPRYEGEGAVLLEAAIEQDTDKFQSHHVEPYPIEIVKNTATAASTAEDTSVLLIDMAPTFAAMLDDLSQELALGIIAKKFHDAIIEAITAIAQTVFAAYGIQTFALTGGVFMNRYLVEHAIEALTALGFTVAINKELPCGDGNVSYGQAVVALALNK